MATTFAAQSSARPLAYSTAGPVDAILVGNGETLSLLLDQLALLPGAPCPVGFIFVDQIDRAAVEPAQDVGTLDDLPALRDRLKPQVAIVSLPASQWRLTQRVRQQLRSLGIPERFVPPITELLDRAPSVAAGTAGGITSSAIAPSSTSLGIDPVDLIGRTPYGIDRKAVAGALTNRRVLITGAGGSIGSELSRIVATFKPETLVLMERSENALFEIDRQIAARFPNLRRKAVLHDIADAEATRRIFIELKPDVVFHAAAHKHVPLMEDHPAHAVNNNFFGTKSVADAAIAAGTDRFVLISSDKAVNPTSVMGATKRLAEMYIQAMHRQCRKSGQNTRFGMVRFGNVLGSACSVLPIWSAQLAEGGPLTVTDPRMTRYFMTIHEAASLVIQAGVLQPDAASAGVFVLDMGEPVNILELAQRFVRQHGMEPVVNDASGKPADLGATIEHDLDGESRVQINISGIRPGEKLHEELAYAAEQLRPSSHPGINVWAGRLGEDFNLSQLLIDLSAVQTSYDREAVIAAIRKHVPEMVVPLKLRSAGSLATETPMDTPLSGDGLGLAA